MAVNLPFTIYSMAKSNFFKRIRKWGAILLLLLLLLLLAFYFAVQNPKFQTYISKKVTEVISETVGAEVDIAKVEIDFFNTVKLQDLLIKDQNNDTLAYFKNATASISYFSLWQKTLLLDNIAIDGLQIKISRSAESEVFNFSFLSKNKQQKTDTISLAKDNNWALNLSELKLQNSSVQFLDSFQNLLLVADIPLLEGAVDAFDIQNGLVSIDKIAIDQPNVWLQTGKGKTNEAKDFEINIPILLQSRKLSINNGQFAFRNTTDTAVYYKTAFNDLETQALHLSAQNIFLFEDSITANINQLSLIDKSGLEIKKLSTNAIVNNRTMQLNDLHLETNNSHFVSDLSLSYRSFKSFQNFADKVRFKANIQKAFIHTEDIDFFTNIEKIGIKGVYSLSAEIKGKLSSLRAKKVELKAGRATQFLGNFSLNGLPNIKETFISLRVNKLLTNYADLKYIHNKIPLPENAKKLGNIFFKGNFDGFYSDFVTYGEAHTDLGSVKTDINFKIDKDNIPAYSGKIAGENLAVGKWFAIDSVGAVSLNTTIKGKGVTLNTLNTELNGLIKSFEFKGYTYENLKVDGSFKNKFFKGKAILKDENIDLVFNGLIDAKQKTPKYNFSAELKKLRLQALNLSPHDYTLSGNLQSNFSAQNIDDLLGKLEIKNFNINYKDKNYTLKQVKVESFQQAKDNKYLQITADNVKANIRGKYQLQQLPKAFKRLFIANDTTKLAPQNIKLDIQITDKTDLLSLFVPKLQIPKEINISGNVNTNTNSALLSVAIPKIKFNTLQSKNFNANIRIQEGKISAISTLPKIYLGDSVIAKDISFLVNGLTNHLDFSLNASNRTENSQMALKGNLSYADKYFTLSLDSTSKLLINSSLWNILPENQLQFNAQGFKASNLNISNDVSAFNFNIITTQGQNNLTINLKDVEVADFAEVLQDKGIDLQGKLNGSVQIDNFDKKPAISGNIAFLDILVNQYKVGNFKLNSRVDVEEKKVYVNGGLFGRENYVDIHGAYSFAKKSTPNDFDINVFIKQITVKTFEDFISEYISNSSGTLNGNLVLKGKRTEPNLEGYVEVNDVTTTVSYTNVAYTIASTVVRFNKNEIVLQDSVEVRDDENNVGFGKGKVTHKNLKDWALDLHVSTNKIKGLNTRIQHNEDFYGTAYLKGGASFTGSTDEPHIYIFGESMGKSFIDVPLLAGVKNEEYKFYTFVQPKKDEVNKETKPKLVKVGGAKVDLDLDLNQNLEVKIILDQDAGDVLKVKGAGNVKIDVGRRAEYVNFFGTYNVLKGDYLFTMQNIINKPFRIEPESKIFFNGDIYEEATIDMSATYSRKVTLYDFISEYIVNETEEIKTLANNRVPVTLSLDLTDKLSKPIIKFDIAIDDVDPRLRNYVDSKLQAIKLNESELNNQIFGVLVMTRFLPSYNSLDNSIGSSTSSNTVINTVTELISSQFSRYLTDLASNVVKGLEFYVNFSSYDPSYLSAETTNLRRELQLALSQRFFNDRLIINVGGDFDFGEDYQNKGNNATFFGGNVSFEYAITKNRRWRIKAFTISDYDSYSVNNNRRTRSGLGFSYKREFDTVFELLNMKKKKKKKTSNGNSKD